MPSTLPRCLPTVLPGAARLPAFMQHMVVEPLAYPLLRAATPACNLHLLPHRDKRARRCIPAPAFTTTTYRLCTGSCDPYLHAFWNVCRMC